MQSELTVIEATTTYAWRSDEALEEAVGDESCAGGLQLWMDVAMRGKKRKKERGRKERKDCEPLYLNSAV